MTAVSKSGLGVSPAHMVWSTPALPGEMSLMVILTQLEAPSQLCPLSTRVVTRLYQVVAEGLAGV